MKRMTPNDLKHLTDKNTLYTLNTRPNAQISLRCALQPTIFEFVENRKCTEWTT